MRHSPHLSSDYFFVIWSVTVVGWLIGPLVP